MMRVEREVGMALRISRHNLSLLTVEMTDKGRAMKGQLSDNMHLLYL